jgi:hypothetical protein
MAKSHDGGANLEASRMNAGHQSCGIAAQPIGVRGRPETMCRCSCSLSWYGYGSADRGSGLLGHIIQPKVMRGRCPSLKVARPLRHSIQTREWAREERRHISSQDGPTSLKESVYRKGTPYTTASASIWHGLAV